MSGKWVASRTASSKRSVVLRTLTKVLGLVFNLVVVSQKKDLFGFFPEIRSPLKVLNLGRTTASEKLKLEIYDWRRKEAEVLRHFMRKHCVDRDGPQAIDKKNGLDEYS